MTPSTRHVVSTNTLDDTHVHSTTPANARELVVTTVAANLQPAAWLPPASSPSRASYQQRLPSSRSCAKSQALPWLSAPAYLQELPGNADFDLRRLGSASPALLKYYREAELEHIEDWPCSRRSGGRPGALGQGAGGHVRHRFALTSKLEAPSVLNGGLDRISPALWGAARAWRRRIARPQAAPRGLRRAAEPGNLQFDPLGNVPRRARAPQAHGRGGGQARPASPCSPSSATRRRVLSLAGRRATRRASSRSGRLLPCLRLSKAPCFGR